MYLLPPRNVRIDVRGLLPSDGPLNLRVGALACLPGPALATLADGCAALGPAGTEALREAGRVAGTHLLDSLGADATELSPAAFWLRVDDRLRELNLGSVRFEALDSALGGISWYGFPEAGAPDGSGRETRGCALATGILAGLLGRAAGDRTVDVLEIGCGARSPHACWFLIGSEARLHEVRRRLAEGGSVAQAVGVA